MKSDLVNRLCLGTAQFGLDYGITNKKGKVSKEEAFKILDYAYKVGIDTIDTAYAYGESEEVIGEFIKHNKPDFKIISKISSVTDFNSEKIRKQLNESFLRLAERNIYGYLVHDFNDFLKNERLWEILKELKSENLLEKIGFSLYKPEELEIIFAKRIDFDILQIPYSVFDRRFEKYFERLNEEGVDIYARSVFLQGLAFMNPDTLPDDLLKAKDYIRNLRDLSLKNEIFINALCLNFALLNPYINKVIIGVDSLEHLKTDLADIDLIERVRGIYNRLEKLNIEDEYVILPYNWVKG